MRDSITANGATGRGVIVYQMTVLASALRFYARTGMQVNRAYTPAAMVRSAKTLLSQNGATAATLRGSRSYAEWADALTLAAGTLAAEINAQQTNEQPAADSLDGAR
jgi:hypothetical protein